MKILIFLSGLLLAQFTFAQDEANQSEVKVWTLEESIAYALNNNITITEASLNMNLAEVNLEKAKSARLPNLFGSVSQNFSNGNTIDPITSDFVSDQIHSTNTGINSSLTLYSGGQLQNQIEQNKILLDQSILLEEVERNNIELNILETYLQALFSKESITMAENNFNASEKEVERAKARLDAETIALSDYTEAQSQAATNKYRLIAAKNDYEQYIIKLKQLLELPPMTEMEIESIDENSNTINITLDKAEVYNNALRALPEMQVMDLNISANKKEMDIVKGAYLPSLTLNGSVGSGYTSINQNNFRDQFGVNFNQRIGVTLIVPIFNRNQTRSAVQTASINIEKAELQKQNTEKDIFQKVETAYQNAISAQEQMIAAESSKIAAEESYKLAQKRYDLDDLSTTDLVISQNTFTNAQQNYLQAKYLNILYHQLLEFYQGNDIKL